jgi:hypothetical protein
MIPTGTTRAIIAMTRVVSAATAIPSAATFPGPGPSTPHSVPPVMLTISKGRVTISAEKTAPLRKTKIAAAVDVTGLAIGILINTYLSGFSCYCEHLELGNKITYQSTAKTQSKRI